MMTTTWDLLAMIGLATVIYWAGKVIYETLTGYWEDKERIELGHRREEYRQLHEGDE